MTRSALIERRPPKADIATQAVPRCPSCDSDRRHPYQAVTEHEYTTTTTDEFSLMECDGCGAWYLDPRPHASELSTIYPPDYYAYVQDKVVKAGRQARIGAALFARRIAPISRHIALGPGKTWLDIGCGNGYVLEVMKHTYGVVGTGLDIAADSVEFCRKRGFRAVAARFEDYDPEPGEAYDLIHSSHVIEHVESPYAYLRKTWDLLKPGGLSVFITPNTSTWEARAFGRHWGGLHVPRHWTMLNPRSVGVLADRVGFEQVETCFSTNGTFWTWTFHSLFKDRLSPRMNDAIFPSDYRFVENSLWNIVRIGTFTVIDLASRLVTGQTSNMLVILRKPTAAGQTGSTG